MDSATLKADIDTLAAILNTVASLSPNAPRIQAYIATAQGIAENPVLLAVLVAFINSIAAPIPVAQAPAKGA